MKLGALQCHSNQLMMAFLFAADIATAILEGLKLPAGGVKTRQTSSNFLMLEGRRPRPARVG
jgi:hypothetical protein